MSDTSGAERIVSIEEYDGKGASGFRIVTDRQVIFLNIDNGQACCEQWGYFWTNDDPQAFIGATIIDVRLTDTALSTTSFYDRLSDDVGCRCGRMPEGVMFVDIVTDRGVLQFVAYNEHNGYYGHRARVISHQLTHSMVL